MNNNLADGLLNVAKKYGLMYTDLETVEEAASALRSSGEAVATVCLVGERYAHGNMVEVQLQLASADAPSPKIGDRYYTTPPTPSAPVVDDAMRLKAARAVRDCLDRDQADDDTRPLELWIADSVLAFSGVIAPVGVEGMISLRREAQEKLDRSLVEKPNDRQTALVLRARLNAIQDCLNIALTPAAAPRVECECEGTGVVPIGDGSRSVNTPCPKCASPTPSEVNATPATEQPGSAVQGEAEPKDDEVICPSCCHQFRAIPVQVQRLMLGAGFAPPFTTPPPALDHIVDANKKVEASGVEGIVNRFLCWKLPDDFAPDNGISFTPISNPAWTHDTWPIGTNLLTAAQASAMFEHCLAAAPSGVRVDDAMVASAADALVLEWNLHYPDATRMAKCALTAALAGKEGA